MPSCCTGSSPTQSLSQFCSHLSSFIHSYNAPRVRTSVVCPTKVETALGKGLKSVDHQL
mgnify:FL=1